MWYHYTRKFLPAQLEKEGGGMKLARSERWILAAVLAAFGAMLLYFAVCALSAKPLAELPPAESRAPAAEQARVDINIAGLDELMTLPGIGPVRAQAILDYRTEHGPFRYPEDLIRVDGIGEGIASGLLDYVTTGGAGDAENFGGG